MLENPILEEFKNITRYKRIGFNIGVIRLTACLYSQLSLHRHSLKRNNSL